MSSYPKKQFINEVNLFQKEHMEVILGKEIQEKELRKKIVEKYPRERLRTMSLEDYLIAPANKGHKESFCRYLYEYYTVISNIQISDRERQETFGISLKYGTQITISENYKNKFGNDYKKVFRHINSEIVSILEGIDNSDYSVFDRSDLSTLMKYILLAIYFPKRVLPIINKLLLERYLEHLGLQDNEDKGMYFIYGILLDWKRAIPEIADWSKYKFISFCDWLYRTNRYVDGNVLKREAQDNAIIQEIEELDIEGKSKEAVVKVRINQRIFRDRLLQRYQGCCLCGISDKELLIASHIKPWRECLPNEKLDIENGFLLCPNHDKLFDGGWITFDDKGKIIISNQLLENERKEMNISEDLCIEITDKNKEYLQYHRMIFKGCKSAKRKVHSKEIVCE